MHVYATKSYGIDTYIVAIVYFCKSIFVTPQQINYVFSPPLSNSQN